MRSRVDVCVGRGMIHPTAQIHKSAQLADDVEVGPYSIIGEDVKVDSGTKIGAHCVVDAWTKIGKNCKIFSGAIVGSASQDLKYKGNRSFLEIGDDNIIREYATINRGSGEDSVTKIGNGNLIMAYAHIAHDCQIGNKVIIANCGTLAGYVVVEDSAIIGGLSGIHQFVRIGTLSIIGGCSKVVKHIPPYAMADGHPTKIYGLNIIGLKRAGISSDVKVRLKKAFKILFNSGLSLPHAINIIKATIPNCKELEHLIEFLNSACLDTHRSVCR